MRDTSIRLTTLQAALFVLALILSFVWSAVAQAESHDARSADVQYKKAGSPSGPVAGTTSSPTPEGSLLIEGKFCVAPGASVTAEDADRTQGTFIDGENASVTQVAGGVLISGSPQNVAGGNQVFDIESASVVSSTGISQQCAEQAAVGGVLPNTAGPSLILFALGGVLVATGAATAFLRRYRVDGRR